MRRREKKITDRDEILKILASEKICRIAFADDSTPYIVPVHYGYSDNALYIHCAKEGRKIDIIKKNNTVCFEIEHDVRIVSADTACRWTTLYTSIIGYGTAAIITDTAMVVDALNVIMKQQSGHGTWNYNERDLGRVAVIKISIETLSCKRGS
jgi:nitroimidazol reductase NimA-like FMN-containing flavoprotein (pyridoxamine 5'-phosphate oxidase superfamily)